MQNTIEAVAPQYVTTWYTQNSWNKVSDSARAPSGGPGPYSAHSQFARFSATCMYFGAELIDNKQKMLGQEEADVPIGLIQSAVGGTQIESWISNATRAKCSPLDDSGGAGGLSMLYHAMVAPFANYSVRGWLWYQGENNCHDVMGSSLTSSGYGCAMPALVDSWREVWAPASSGPDERIFGIATLAGGGPAAEGSNQNMAGMRWSQTANYGVWPNKLMPHVFGAQLYDIGEPMATSDGNKRVLNKTACDAGTCAAALNAQGQQQLDCCWKGTDWKDGNCTIAPSASNPGGTKKPCTDVWNCSLGDPETGKYGPTCMKWSAADLLPSLRPVAPWLKLNSPSGIPGNQFMGSIHPRLKRPVGRRLAYAAAHMLKHQQQRRRSGGAAELANGGGASTGPTIAGCHYTAGSLELLFNSSLLGGEELLLRKFDANETGGWNANPFNDSAADYHPYKSPEFLPTIDALGAMVCTADEHGHGNASTCGCQSWDWTLHNTSEGNGNASTVWFCETPSGNENMWRPADPSYTKNRGHSWRNHRPGRYSPTPNLFYRQWAPATLQPSKSGGAAVVVDLSGPRLKGRTPLAVRYAWPLFSGFHGATADTCCPTRVLQDGHGICLPGSCPLYTNESELPANPFFAVVGGGRCHCKAPQTCDESTHASNQR